MRWLVLIALLTSLPASAKEPPPEAKAHFEAGDKAYKLGDFARAVEEYRKSYELFPVPLLLYDLAQAHRQLGNIDKALFSYKQYLAEAPTGKYRPIAEQKVAELEKLLEDQRKSKLAPPNGPATLDKDPAAATSAPTRAAPEATPAPAPEAPPPTSPPPTSEPPRSKTLLIVVAAVAAVVIIGAAVGIGVAVASAPHEPMTPFGTLSVMFK